MMIEVVIAKKKKYICLLTSPLFHVLKHEIINLIYLFIIVIYIYYINIMMCILNIYI